jgi:hypothetical protein
MAYGIPDCLIKKVLEIHSLPHIKNVSEGSEWKMPKALAYLLRKGGQDMPLTLREKQSVTRELSVRYARSSKKKKSQLVVQLMELTGYTRSYATK